MNQTKISKIKRFLDDKIMADAVKEVLVKHFLKPRGFMDVEVLAAERIAINLLEESFKELEKYAAQQEKEEKVLNQIGL